MPDSIRGQILKLVLSPAYRPLKPRQLANAVDAGDDENYPAFKAATNALLREGLIALGTQNLILPPRPTAPAKGKAAKPAKAARPEKAPHAAARPAAGRAVGKAHAKPEARADIKADIRAVAAADDKPAAKPARTDEITGTYRQNKKGFGFVMPLVAGSSEDVFIPEGQNGPAAITGDVVVARITNRQVRDGQMKLSGRIAEVVERKNKRFVGTLTKKGTDWLVLPDGNTYAEPIYTPDAATKYIKPGTKVVVEITEFPTRDEAAMGVITETLGNEGDKDVDLRSIMVQFNLPGPFPDEVKDQASAALEKFKREIAAWGASKPDSDLSRRYDMTGELVCTIDPDDAKDYDDAISLQQLDSGEWELGVHIADVSHFVPEGSPLDVEARERGNSTYFPGHVIPMLPEVLSNGICSLQEGVPRLCKSAFIVIGDDARPVRTRFSNTIIKSRKRLRYREAQAIIDAAGDENAVVPHPEGDRKVGDYEPEIVRLLADMDALSRRIQKRRHAAGQLVLNLPAMELVLSEEGKVVDAIPEDQSFTHTLIEMFMVEANEAVARLLDALDLPFLRRTHPEPESKSSDRLKHFLASAGHGVSGEIDRHVLQALLAKVKGKPEGFAVNLAVLRSLSRAEYSPKQIGHYALASTHYGHFTSPIRRYADLTVHRLLDGFFAAIDADFSNGPLPKPKGKIKIENVITFDEALQVGKNLSYTERRSEEAERELRQVKILELMQTHIGEEFVGVVTGVTSFGIFIQLQQYLIEGLIRYPELLNDFWEVDEKAGSIRGRKTGQRIRIGDVAKVRIVRVELPRRELELAVLEVLTRGTGEGAGEAKSQAKVAAKAKPGHPVADARAPKGKPRFTEGATKRSQRSKSRDRGKSAR
jgi:ribonuclease R